jgi:NAD(P)-dependent dehydrogenase (short-subunit alcohol dehydrogenase family)
MKILVSGASSGIGYELVKKFMAGGHRVIAFARRKQSLESLADEVQSLPGDFYPLSFDLLSEDYQPLVEWVKTQLQTIDAMVNNAGFLVNKPLLELTDRDIQNSFAVNVFSVFKLSRELFPFMHASTHVVNIASMGGYQGSAKFSGLSAYSASKAALAVLTECMAEEWAEYGIKVNALALGATQTEMLAQAFPGYQAPLTAEQMADFIAGFTLSGHHHFNGKILPVSLSTP